MKVERRIHSGWEEWQRIPEKTKKTLSSLSNKGWCGKYQYICTSDDESKRISLVHIDVGLSPHRWVWEIYCLRGAMFEDVERFKTKKQAMIMIRGLLK